MAFTANSDFYAAVHDSGINTIVKHIMRQRPSLFNYGTAQIQANPSLLCQRIDAAPAVTRLITVMQPIPLPTPDPLALDFAAQITNVEIDFHPGDILTLPPQLNPPLALQRMALRAHICAGLSCIPKEVRQMVPVDLSIYDRQRTVRRSSRQLYSRRASIGEARSISAQSAADLIEAVIAGTMRPPKVLPPINKLNCFCIEVFGIANSNFNGQAGNQRLFINADNFELVDIEPDGLENSMECYINLLLNRMILPQISDMVSELAFRLHELPPLPDSPDSLGSIQISASTLVPNPAIEDNQLKLFTNLEKLELNIPPITIGGEGGEEPPTPIRTERSRSRTGPSHITAAVSESTFRRIFEVVRDTGLFKITAGPSKVSLLGVTGSAKANIEFHLDNGTIQFQNDNTIRIDELDIKWDKLEATLGIDLPSLCFKACVPFTDICTDLGCLFEGDPDFSIPISIPAIFTTEVSLNASLKTYYSIGTPKEWLVYITPSRVDVDIIDIADTVGDLLDSLLDDAIKTIGLPDWADFLADQLVGIVRGLLDIPDDVGEWLQGLIFDTLGIEITIESYVTKWLADKTPIFRLENPVQVVEAEADLIPVNIPILFLSARVNADEMILEADVED